MYTKKLSRVFTIFFVLPVIFGLMVGNVAPLSANASQVPNETEAQLVAPGPKVVIRANPEISDLYIPRRDKPLHIQEATATITVNYIPPGWTPEAQAAFQFAVDIWQPLITSPVPILVDARFENLGGGGILGMAGPYTIYREFPNTPEANTWYAVATANSLAGFDLDTENPDIEASLNSSFIDWDFGTGSSTPGDKISFVSVVLHELGHGLGFLGSMNVAGGVGTYGYGEYPEIYPIIYDKYTENAAGTALLSYTNGSSELATQLQSGNVFFDAPYANFANAGSRVELYAPNPWQLGSSYSHLDEVFNGTPHALMTYSINYGETEHDPGAVTLCMFKDMGWEVAEECESTADEYPIYLPLILSNCPQISYRIW